MSQAQSPLEQHRDFVETLLAQDKSYTFIVGALKDKGVITSRHSLRRAIQRWELVPRRTASEPSGMKVDGDKAEARSVPATDLPTPDELLESRGLNPEEWEVTNIKVNEWDAPTGDTLRQLTVNCKKVRPLSLLLPAIDVKPKTRKPPRVDKTKARLVVMCGDQQAPFHDPELHEKFCEWLRKNKPTEGVLIGDTVDFPEISRHRHNPEWVAKTQDCVNSGYLVLRDYVLNSENTKWSKLPGNHDERLRNCQIENIADLYGLRRAEVPGELLEHPVASVPFLLRLEELGIEWVNPNGEYAHGQVQLCKNLAVRHGWIAKKGSGTSALATLEHLGYSVVVGHTHRQSLVHKTTHDISGEPSTLAGVEAGCMCQVRDGLGYAIAPDWQQGFATASVWPDGKFKIDLATYVNGNLYWRDQRY